MIGLFLMVEVHADSKSEVVWKQGWQQHRLQQAKDRYMNSRVYIATKENALVAHYWFELVVYVKEGERKNEET